MTDVRDSPSGPLVDLAEGLVTSVFGRTGDVVAVSDDYAASEVTNDSTVVGATVKDAIETVNDGNPFDFVITDKSDFPAPVGGIITLAAGSYAIKNSIALGTDRLLIDNGTLIMGMGPGKVISTTIASEAVITINAGKVAMLLHLTVENLDGAGRCITNSSNDATIINCRLLGGAQGFRVLAGDMTAVACLCSGNTNGIELVGGELRLDQQRCLNNVIALNISGNSETLVWVGGWIKNLNAGVKVDADITALHLNGVSCSSGSALLEYVSGAVERVSVINCQATSFDGVIWAAASIPSLGLTLGHNIWDNAGDAYSGFTELTARVNSKGDVDSAGLKSETPIVP